MIQPDLPQDLTWMNCDDLLVLFQFPRERLPQLSQTSPPLIGRTKNQQKTLQKTHNLNTGQKLI